MVSSLDRDVGVAPSKPARTKMLTLDLTAVTSYNSGGETLAVLTTALEGFTEAEGIMAAHHDGSAERFFKVDVANAKLQAFDTATVGDETAGAVDLSGHTDVKVMIVGE